MLLARLQVERGDVPLALETLQKTLPYAGELADYQSFVAALQQRQSHHEEAVAHYQIALKLAPNNGLWLMGMGISLQALQRKEEARDAYLRALATNSLSAQLQAYVQQKLKEL
jgi:MSHA biogenesis protein MshN